MNTALVVPFSPEMMSEAFSQNLKENHLAAHHRGSPPCLRVIEENPPKNNNRIPIVDQNNNPILLDGRHQIYRDSFHYKSGDKVYKHFKPQTPGIVYQTFAAEHWDLHGKRFFGIKQILQIRWLPNAKEKKKGIPFSESYEHAESVSGLLSLIWDHERKLKKHKDNAKSLERLIEFVDRVKFLKPPRKFFDWEDVDSQHLHQASCELPFGRLVVCEDEEGVFARYPQVSWTFVDKDGKEYEVAFPMYDNKGIKTSSTLFEDVKKRAEAYYLEQFGNEPAN